MHIKTIEDEILNFFQDEIEKCDVNGRFSQLGLLIVDTNKDARKIAGRIDQKLDEEELYVQEDK